MARWYRISDTEWIQASDVTLIVEADDMASSCGQSAIIESWVIPHAVTPPSLLDDEMVHLTVLADDFRANNTKETALATGAVISAVIECNAKLDFSWFGPIGNCISGPSINKPLAFNSSISYFCVGANNISQVAIPGRVGNRPIVLTQAWGTSPAQMIVLIEQYHNQIVAVNWDYEYAIDLTLLVEVHDAANYYGLPLMVASAYQPGSAVHVMGFTFQDAKNHVEMVIPQLYAQHFGNDPVMAKRRLDSVLAISTVPVLVEFTIEVTNKTEAKLNPLSPATIQSVYAPMNLNHMLIWNGQNMDAAQWTAVESVLV